MQTVCLSYSAYKVNLRLRSLELMSANKNMSFPCDFSDDSRTTEETNGIHVPMSSSDLNNTPPNSGFYQTSVISAHSLNKTTISQHFQNMKERLNLSLDSASPRTKSLDNESTDSTDFQLSVDDVETSPCNEFERFFKHFRDKVIQHELSLLRQHQQDGIYVVPSVKSLQIWFGVIFIREGPYKEGIFHFTIFFNDDYPESRPVFKFKSKIFHPQIDPRNGRLNTKPAYSKLKGNHVHTWGLLEYTRSCFYHLNIRESKNSEAAFRFKMDLNTFLARCRASVLDSLLEFEEQRLVGHHETESPFRSRLIDNGVCEGIKAMITTKTYHKDKTDGMVEWAKNQFGKMINNISYYSPVVYRDERSDLTFTNTQRH